MVLLFASGVSALVFQILWIKQLSLVVGVDVVATSLAISGFFAGLALGAAVFGRRADVAARPVRLYVALESSVAVTALLLSCAFPSFAAPFARIENAIGPIAWSLPFLAVALPAFFMGGTLPVLMRAVTGASRGLGAAGGRLYAANTAGAIAGTLLASFLLIPALGIRGAALAAALLNLLAAAVAWLLRRRLAAADGAHTAAGVPAADAPPGASRALALYALAGGLALGYELVWSQALVQFMSTRAHAFSVMLAVLLTGLALGSAIHARRADRVENPWGAFGVLIAAAGLLALAGVALVGDWLPMLQTAVEAKVRAATDSVFAGMSARFAVAAFAVVFLPALALGAAFPAAVRLCVDAGAPGRGLGRVLAWNTLGGIAGSLLTGLVLVPRFGLIHSLAALGLAATAIGLYAAFAQAASPAQRAVTATIAGLMLAAAVATPQDRLAQLLADSRGGSLALYRESRGGTVAVLEQESGTHSLRRLYIQGVSNSGDTLTSLRYMRLQALLPLIIHNGEPKSALVVGLGTGITAGALLAYPGLEKRVVAELLPAVVEAAPRFHGNYNVTRNPQVDIRLRDGRRELLASDAHYDLITLEPPPPSAAGVVNLYSRDFYALAAARLNANGIVAQWLPLPTQNEEDTQALVRAFLDVFPHASLWTTELHETLLVGSLTPLTLDAQRIAQRFKEPEIAAALGEVGVDSPAALLATWVTDRKGLERYADDAEPVTDDRPRIEYANWVRPGEFSRVLPKVFALHTKVALRGADAALHAAIERDRDHLLTFYEAGLYAYSGDRKRTEQSLQWVLAREPDNPYYLWMMGRID